jgi:hypothetical protein
VLGNDKRLNSCSAGIGTTATGGDLSFDVDDVGGRAPNCKHRIESDDDMHDAGEAQERSEEGVGMGGCGNL